MSTKVKLPEWVAEWQAKYPALLVSGLTDGPMYVRLATKSLPMLDVVVALKPFISRVTSKMVMVGGKLAVFPIKETLKAQPASEQVMVGWLRAAYPNIEFPKFSGERVGTIVAAPQGAPYGAGAAYREAFKESSTVNKLVDHIESLIGEPVAERAQVERAITDAMLAQLPSVFGKFKVETPTKEELVNDTEYADGSNVIAFGAKANIVSILSGDMAQAIESDMKAAPHGSEE